MASPSAVARDAFNVTLADLVKAQSAPFRIMVAKDVDMTNSIEEIFAAESPNIQARPTFTATYAADATDKRAEGTDTQTITASGGTLTYNRIFLLMTTTADGTPSTTGPQSFTNSGVNASTDTITLAGHGFSDDDRVIIVAASGSTLPGGLPNPPAIKYVGSSTTDTFQLYDAAGAAGLVDIVSTGSGTFYAIAANGLPMGFSTEATDVTLGDGATKDIVLDAYWMRVAGTTTGV